jgi:hypothetical protein
VGLSRVPAAWGTLDPACGAGTPQGENELSETILSDILFKGYLQFLHTLPPLPPTLGQPLNFFDFHCYKHAVPTALKELLKSVLYR